MVFGVAVGIVLGGTQALARSYYSLAHPGGKEAEYFSFYDAMDRGTSWFGTLVFGLVYQFTDSYRPAIFALIAFFLVGGFLLTRVDTERGIREAGNALPAVSDRIFGLPLPWKEAGRATLPEVASRRHPPLVRSPTHSGSAHIIWRWLNGGSARYVAHGSAARVSRTSAGSSSRPDSRSATAASTVTSSRSRCPSRRTSRRSGSAPAVGRRHAGPPASSPRSRPRRRGHALGHAPGAAVGEGARGHPQGAPRPAPRR